MKLDESASKQHRVGSSDEWQRVLVTNTRFRCFDLVFRSLMELQIRTGADSSDTAESRMPHRS